MWYSRVQTRGQSVSNRLPRWPYVAESTSLNLTIFIMLRAMLFASVAAYAMTYVGAVETSSRPPSLADDWASQITKLEELGRTDKERLKSEGLAISFRLKRASWQSVTTTRTLLELGPRLIQMLEPSPVDFRAVDAERVAAAEQILVQCRIAEDTLAANVELFGADEKRKVQLDQCRWVTDFITSIRNKLISAPMASKGGKRWKPQDTPSRANLPAPEPANAQRNAPLHMLRPGAATGEYSPRYRE